MSVQAPRAVALIRPRHFVPNPETIADNAFQGSDQETVRSSGREGISAAAHEEVTRVAEALVGAGITVHVFDDEDPDRPDSVFPNNWLSTHAGGRIGVHPMSVPNRRRERRWDIVEDLKRRYRVQDVIDSSGLEPDGVFLEGTGAMVLDRGARIAYVARSRRADPVALERFCTEFGYEPMVFDASDPAGMPIYHTNVMMCIATDFALIGLGLITDSHRRREVAERLGQHGRTVLDLSFEQVRNFAGNAIELQAPTGRILAMSRRGVDSLTGAQREVIEASCRILPLDVPTIELAGGSVRCMIVGIFLDPRPQER